MKLTLRQKIGQIALCSLDGREMTPRDEEFLREYRVGNIIHFGNNVSGFEDTREFNRILSDFVAANCEGIRPLIAVDHEGGRVMRFSRDFTWFPSQMALGAADDAALSEAVGRAMGYELYDAGFNFSLSPVVDINVNKLNPVIGVRAFGDEAGLVIRHAGALSRGLQNAGVMNCLKHYPGSGDTGLDSHYDLPLVDKGGEELEKAELLPYRALCGEASAVMTTHILFPALEKEGVPATMSRAMLTELLRNDIGFKGIIVTDGMQMKAIADHYGVERGCVQAVKAGADLICIGTGGPGVMHIQKNCLDALYEAAVSGEIPIERIDEAVSRILEAKRRFPLSAHARTPDFAANDRLNAEVCRKAATSLGKGGEIAEGNVLCASDPIKEVAFGLTHADPRSLSFASMAAEVLGARSATLDEASEAEGYDSLIIGIKSIYEGCAELNLARAALQKGRRVCFAVVGAPYGADLLPDGCKAVCTYALTSKSVLAALDVLCGREKALGALPVRI